MDRKEKIYFVKSQMHQPRKLTQQMKDSDQVNCQLVVKLIKKRGDRELISTAQRSTKSGNVSLNNLPNLRRSSNRHLITLNSVFVKA